jgi:hypothetical protein
MNIHDNPAARMIGVKYCIKRALPSIPVAIQRTEYGQNQGNIFVDITSLHSRGPRFPVQLPAFGPGS